MPGNIIKVGKKYRVTMELGKDEKGKRLRKYVTVSTEAEAKKILNEFEYNYHQKFVVPSSRNLSEFLDEWFEHYVMFNCEETTRYGYKNIIQNHLKPRLGSVLLQELQPIHIQNYYTYLQTVKKLSPNTVHKHHATLKMSTPELI